MFAGHSTGTLEEARDLLALETGPATPKVDVRAAVFGEDRILLVKEAGESGWSLPGGWADVGESPSEAAARETLEESGYRVRPLRLLAAYATATGTATRPSPTTSTSWCTCARSWTRCLHPTWTPTGCASSASMSFLSSRSPALPGPRSHASSSTTATRTYPPTSTSARTVNPWAANDSTSSKFNASKAPLLSSAWLQRPGPAEGGSPMGLSLAQAHANVGAGEC
jgi:ADP-ribose pyrophosphatase YjhB (NUDIX family)